MIQALTIYPLTWKLSIRGLLAVLLLSFLVACGGVATSPAPTGTVKVSIAGNGAGAVTSSPGGITCGASCSAVFEVGSQVILTATPTSGSTFAGWSGGSCSGTGTCAMAVGGTEAIIATFTAAANSYALSVAPAGNGTGTITSAPGGIDCGTTCRASYVSGTQITLTATPSANSTFAGWGGACSGTASCVVTMTANESVTANFSGPANTYALTVDQSGTGTGVITSAPAGINCGSTCEASFAAGTAVTLTPTPSANSTFTGWAGACTGTSTCTVTMNANATVTASFAGPGSTYTLTVADAGTGTGTVTSTPAGINCGSACASAFAPGTQVTLAATAGSNSTFAGWTGACTGTGPCAITMNANASVTATFTASPVSFNLTVTLSGTGGGTVTSTPAGINCGTTCTAAFPAGTEVTLTSTPSANSYLVNWGGACTGSSTCTVDMSTTESVSAAINVWPINHIIFFAQENRSFDHYFGQLRQYWAQNGIPDQSFDGLPQFNPTSGIAPLYGAPPSNPGCNPDYPYQAPPAPFQDCVYDPSTPVTSYQLVTQCIENPSPFWNEAHVDWDYNDPTGLDAAQLNGFVFSAAHDVRENAYNNTDPMYDTSGIRAMGYYEGNDLNYYYFMASNFGTSDRWFSPVLSRTNPNREYLVAATSQGYVYPIGSNQNDQNLITSPTIFQELQTAGITWKIYVNPTNTGCSGPPYLASCLLQTSYIKNFAWGQTIPTDYPNNIGTIGVANSDFDNDLANGTLPQVVQIEPASDAGLDEHPSTDDLSPSNIQYGAEYAAGIINQVMQSSSWQSTAFLFTYDEPGGLYDHVAPQTAVNPDGIAPSDLESTDICYGTPNVGTCNFTYTGYRVPLIVISPYAKKNYVSHTVEDTTAILKFIETRFGLPALTARDAAQPSMAEYFNFNNPPWATPPTPPAQVTNGQCYVNTLP